MPRRLAAPFGIVLVFALLVALRLHGFSLAIWHDRIDGSEATEVLLGTPQEIRSDDWKVHLPLALAQAADEPAFALENRLIGLGQSALLPIVELPVAHPLAVFRPTTWGFVLGPDAGLAWLWWSRVLGLLVVWYGVLLVLSAGQRGIAAAGALAVTAAPFFQFWSFNAAPHAAAAGGVFLAALWLLRARRPAAILASGVVLGFAVACFALAIYPPYQVTLAWLVVALLAGCAIELRESRPWRERAGLRLVAALGGAVFALAAAALFASVAGETIETLRQTVYPGRRLSSGGGRSLAQLANSTLATGLWTARWGRLENICEAASFWLLAPAPALLWCVRWLRGERIDPLAAALLVYLVALVAFAVAGAPTWLASASGLSFAPGSRVVIGIGLADTALVVRWLACAAPLKRSERPLGLALAVVWAALLGAGALALARELPDVRLLLPGVLAAANGGLAWLALSARQRVVPLALLGALSLVSALWFHPLTVGGTRWLVENDLSQRIRAIDRAAQGDTLWASFGSDEIGNLFRILGVRSITGVHPVPQLALWRRIDPSAAQRRIYDRYAHVTLKVAPAGPPTFRLDWRDSVELHLDPGGPTLRELGVTHVLFRGGISQRLSFERQTGFEPLGGVANNHLYRIPTSDR